MGSLSITCKMSFISIHFVQRSSTHILSVNEKLPLLKFRYFENYKRHLDSYFTFRVSDHLQTRLEIQKIACHKMTDRLHGANIDTGYHLPWERQLVASRSKI